MSDINSAGGDEMAELRKEPSVQELLDRIVRLERRAATLESELAEGKKWSVTVKGHFDDVRGALAIHEMAMDEIWDRLMPVVYKIFPGLAKTNAQIGELMKNAAPIPAEKRKKMKR
jgi:hypothetical protein